MDGGVAELNAGLLIVGPSGRVSDGGVDVLQGNWEVHNEEIEVLQAPVCELLAGNGLNLVTIVEGVPELADDEEVLTLHQAILDSAGNALTSFFLVAVIAGTIKQSVAGLDGVVDSVGTGGIVDFPETETDLWHRVAIVELDNWACHCCCFLKG